MSPQQSNGITRRAFLWKGLAIPAALALVGVSGKSVSEMLNSGTRTPVPPTAAPEATPILLPTPACGDDDDDPTPAQTEGPFFAPNSPERTSLLETGMTGTPMLLAGYVLSTDCRPLANMLLDFWHADDAGIYDNVGYRLRGHQFTDDEGRFLLETIVPGLYPGRTRHFHVKVQAANKPVLTTQLYFPDEPQNERDRIFNPDLLITMDDTRDVKLGLFTFVLDV